MLLKPSRCLCPNDFVVVARFPFPSLQQIVYRCTYIVLATKNSPSFWRQALSLYNSCSALQMPKWSKLQTWLHPQDFRFAIRLTNLNCFDRVYSSRNHTFVVRAEMPRLICAFTIAHPFLDGLFNGACAAGRFAR